MFTADNDAHVEYNMKLELSLSIRVLRDSRVREVTKESKEPNRTNSIS